MAFLFTVISAVGYNVSQSCWQSDPYPHFLLCTKLSVDKTNKRVISLWTARVVPSHAAAVVSHSHLPSPAPPPQFHTISIIAEGIPENMTKKLNKRSRERGVAIIGPATVR